MKREHNWNREDAIITFYCNEFGTSGLLVDNEKEIAESVIGSSLHSLTQMKLNFDYLKGVGNRDHTSEHQREVFDQYHNTPKEELANVVNDIILKRDLVQNKEDYKAAKKFREAKAVAKSKQEKRQAELDEIWRRMGKDPNKMKKVIA